jgi:6-phosphogluconolactonase
MYEALVDADLPWEATRLFQVDERVAPAGDPDRNLTHIVLALPPALQDRIRPMPVGEDDLEAASGRYAEELCDPIDLVHLGIGPDGHTASLVPDDAVLEVADRRVAMTAGEYEGHRRMTLTYPALDAARRIVWLVAGENKRDATTRMLDGDEGIPAGRVGQANATLVADSAALPT